MKKLLSIILALSMLLGLSTAVFAAESNSEMELATETVVATMTSNFMEGAWGSDAIDMEVTNAKKDRNGAINLGETISSVAAWDTIQSLTVKVSADNMETWYRGTEGANAAQGAASGPAGGCGFKDSYTEISPAYTDYWMQDGTTFVIGKEILDEYAPIENFYVWVFNGNPNVENAITFTVEVAITYDATAANAAAAEAAIMEAVQSYADNASSALNRAIAAENNIEEIEAALLDAQQAHADAISTAGDNAAALEIANSIQATIDQINAVLETANNPPVEEEPEDPVEEPVEEPIEEPEEKPASTAKSSNTVMIIGIVAAVVIIIAGLAVIIFGGKKKK